MKRSTTHETRYSQESPNILSNYKDLQYDREPEREREFLRRSNRNYGRGKTSEESGRGKEAQFRKKEEELTCKGIESERTFLKDDDPHSLLLQSCKWFLCVSIESVEYFSRSFF